MNTLNKIIIDYLQFCESQKRLSFKTLKAYRIDLFQFSNFTGDCPIDAVNAKTLENYISTLHMSFKPKTVKRKIASVKALFHYLDFRELLENNPFNHIQIHFREPKVLPKTIPLSTMEVLLQTIHNQMHAAKTPYQRKNVLRDAAVCELLFASGMRISELCSLHNEDISLSDGTILIYGKGSKERKLQLGSKEVLSILKRYKKNFSKQSSQSDFFFVNQAGQPLSDQSIRRALNKYTKLAGIDLHITPHMFRHTFATGLLEADVDIRYIQEMLGHSSINTTEIYTHVTVSKQHDILMTKHPRSSFKIRD